MNLLALTAGQIGAVNQNVPLVVRVSTGYGQDAAFKQTPTYASPGAGTATFAGAQATVTALTLGRLDRGQRLVVGSAFATVVEQLSGTPGGIGVYRLDRAPGLTGSYAFETVFVLLGQVQPMGWKDIQLTQGLNLQGTIRKIYFYGQVQAILRVDRKGGDLVTDPAGNVWLVNNVLEDFVYSGWCSVAATLQNGA